MTARILLYVRWKLNAWRTAYISNRMMALRDESLCALSETEQLSAELTKRRAKADAIKAEWDASA